MERDHVDLWIEEILKKGNITSVLDIGAGNLIDALACARAGARVDAVDIKPMPPIERRDEEVTYHQTDIASWFTTNHFKKYDLVILRSILHYLSPQFIFETLTPTLGSLANTSGFVYVFLSVPPPDSERFIYSADEITGALQKVGFALQKQECVVSNKKTSAVRLLYQKS
jgi:SAM-dependent methyltransferase